MLAIAQTDDVSDRPANGNAPETRSILVKSDNKAIGKETSQDIDD
jgi:hypothetical protein